MTRQKIAQRIRERRARMEFESALSSASPGMRQELLVAAMRQNAKG